MHSSILRQIWLNFMRYYLIFFGSNTVFTILFWISNFFSLSTTEGTYLVEMRIWCIKIGIVLVLHFNPWVDVSAGGL